MTTPAGWYPDTQAPGQERYWDGQQWTPSQRLAGAVPPKKGGTAWKWIVGVIGVIVLLGIIGAATGSDSKDNAAQTTPTVAPTSVITVPPTVRTQAPVKPAPVAPAKPSKPEDKGWVLQSFQTKNDGAGDFGGVGRITNTNPDPATGIFTITLTKAGNIVGTLQGSADTVRPGQTVTVTFISEDPFVRGTLHYDFQTDMSG